MERRFKVTVNGREYDVTVEDLSSAPATIIPQPGDMQVPAPPPAPPPPAATAGSSDPHDLCSPLAGVLVEIGVETGAEVSDGQLVLVIEAMKMKTRLHAHRAGRIASIHVRAGDAVDAGQALLRIE